MKYYIDELPGDISKSSPHKFDENDVILTKIPYTQKYHYHTTSIASYAIMNSDNPKIFDTQIKWLVNNIDQDGAYRHNFTFPYYSNFPKPWIGGLCQGLAISALIKAYNKYDKKIYLNTAKKTFNCLNRSTEDNGCTFIDKNGYMWIEEYPVIPHPHILNGFIYALFGVHELYEVTKSKHAKKLFDDSLRTLEKYLYKYDLGYWSKYSVTEKYPATEYYHGVHIKQLSAIFRLTENEFFNSYKERWESYSQNIYKRLKAKKERTLLHIRRYGLTGCVKRYNERRRWLYG